MRIISVVGARPNFMKIAPFIRAIIEYNNNHDQQLEHLLVHTGQHYDDRMSDSFFSDLGIPEPDINLGIGSGTHAEQVGNTMIEFERVLLKFEPDWVVVVGDVNATLACSVTAKKEKIKVCHIEAGLRSGDMAMPEEINRLVTDRLSDLLFTPDLMASENLRKEGVPEEKIKFVGNIMIDTLEINKPRAELLNISDIITRNIIEKHTLNRSVNSVKAAPLGFALVTLHRPSNVDEEEIFLPLVDFLLNEVASTMPVLWPVHPRAFKQLGAFGAIDKIMAHDNMVMLYPVGYLEMLRLNMDARVLLTDSGGLQEECTVLGTPCLTLRWNTERPVTLKKHGGASILVGNHIENIRKSYYNIIQTPRNPYRPELWDGHTAMRIVDILANT